MIYPSGTFGNVCHTPIPKLDKFLLNTYLLNPISGKDGIHPWIGLLLLAKFSIGRVGRKSIRPTNAYDKGQMIRPTRYVQGGAIHPYRNRISTS